MVVFNGGADASKIDFAVYDVLSDDLEKLNDSVNYVFYETSENYMNPITIIVSEVENFTDNVIPDSFFKHDITVAYA